MCSSSGEDQEDGIHAPCRLQKVGMFALGLFNARAKRSKVRFLADFGPLSLPWAPQKGSKLDPFAGLKGSDSL